MSLAKLRRTDARSRNMVLAEAANYLLPRPFDFSDAPKGLVAEVMDEVDSMVHVRDEDEAHQLRQRIVTRELRENLLAGADIKAIRERVGKKGLLSPSLYDVSFRPNFLNLNVGLGVSRTMVQNVISRPTHVQHLFPEEQGISGLDEHSLFTGPVPGHDKARVLILAIRKFAKLEVDGAWLIFGDDVPVDLNAQPVDVLKAFALKYGPMVEVADRREPFILLEAIPASYGQQSIKFVGELHEKMDVRTSFSFTAGMIKVALAFGVRLKPYMNDLREHGVHLTRKV